MVNVAQDFLGFIGEALPGEELCRQREHGLNASSEFVGCMAFTDKPAKHHHPIPNRPRFLGSSFFAVTAVSVTVSPIISSVVRASPSVCSQSE